MEFLKRLWNDDEGQGMVEYGLILALVSIVVIVILTAVGTNLGTIFGRVRDALVAPAAGGEG